MKRLSLSAIALVATTSCALAQTALPEGMEILTPEGVTVTTSSDRSFDKPKNITIAGSPQKGYLAFFTAKEDTHGEELWVSDGTVAGTKMVKEIYPGTVSSGASMTRSYSRPPATTRPAASSGSATVPKRVHT